MTNNPKPGANQPCYYCGHENPSQSDQCSNCGAPLILQQRYRLLRVLGQGGFGLVYEADDMRLNRRCAIKRVSASSLAEQKLIRNEVDILAHHASRLAFIPTIHDVWVDQNQTYIVMEYIGGPTLDQVEERWTAERVEEFLRVMLNSLSQLHAVGIIHRDLKPLNIKYTPQGRCPYMLLDFGIAKQGAATSVRALSPDYAPPEQMQGIATDARSDLYSLAATAYHLLTGRSPLRERVQSGGHLSPPSQFAPDTSPILEQTLLLMLEQDQQKRPPDAEAALALLNRAPAAPATARVAATGLTMDTTLPVPPGATVQTAQPVPLPAIASPPSGPRPASLPVAPALPSLQGAAMATPSVPIPQRAQKEGLSDGTKILVIVSGILLALPGSCGVLMALAMIPDIGETMSSGNELTASTVLCIALPSLVMAILGGSLLTVDWRARRARQRASIEDQILHAAAQNNYRISATDVAMLTDLSLEEARTQLEQMARQGMISVEIGEQGQLIYRFIQ